MVRRVVVSTTCLLAACTPIAPYSDPPDAQATVDAAPLTTITVTLDELQPGWLVTTSRLVGSDSPDEQTITSDGTPITLTGTNQDVFIATITDATGALLATRAMHAPCTLASPHRLDVPADYSTIQAAIDAALPGDTVKVAPGTYREAVQLRAGICLLGSGAKHTTLDAAGARIRLVDASNAPGSVIAGFTFRGVAPKLGCANEDPFTCSGDWYTAGVFLGGTQWLDATSSAPPIIANNIFDANYIGVMLNWHGIAVVRNNVFVDNRNGFIANHYQDRTLLVNNVFVNNTELAIGNQAAYLDIIDNAIVGSPLGVRFEYIQTGHIACNVFFGNGANANDDRFTIGSDGNVEADPQFLGNGDWHLSPNSPGKDHGCHAGKVIEPDGTPPDIGAYGGPLAGWADL